ncbi:MAG: peptidoglycan-binding protein [Verrucomicrobiales bacterium]
MKPKVLHLIFPIITLSFLGLEASAQERRWYPDRDRYEHDVEPDTHSRYERGTRHDERYDRIPDQVRELNSRLARVRTELRTYGGGRRARYQFAQIESQVDHLNTQFRSGRYDRAHVRQELAELDGDLRRLSADLRAQHGGSEAAPRDSRSGYLEYHPTTVQRCLQREGYYRGPIDGAIGPGTSRAIIRFQTDRGLRATGRIDSELLRLLGVR